MTGDDMNAAVLRLTDLSGHDLNYFFSADRELLSVVITKLSHVSIRHLSLDQQRDCLSFRGGGVGLPPRRESHQRYVSATPKLSIFLHRGRKE